MKFKWEEIANNTYRAKVWGGWVLHCSSQDYLYDDDGNAMGMSEAMVFIPDINHQWVIDEKDIK